jgi:pimeloyl-ACP methyl ester carboxylesterase
MALYDKRDFNGTELRAFAGNFLYSTGANEVAGRYTAGPLRPADAPLHRAARWHHRGRPRPGAAAVSVLPHFTTLGTGPTVLMLHGIGGGHLAFAPQVETLASAGYRAVAWDMPGYGHSAPIEPYTFKGLAESCIR